MAFTIVVENGSGLVAANSYSSEAEASSHFEGHLYSTEWDDAAVLQREIALAMASRLLDEWVDWDGRRATEDQGLRWPRYSVKDRDGWTFDSDIVPDFLKVATAEFALYLLRGDSTKSPDTLGFKEIKIDTLNFVIDAADRDKIGAIPDAVLTLIEPYGEIRVRGGNGTAKLSRA